MKNARKMFETSRLSEKTQASFAALKVLKNQVKPTSTIRGPVRFSGRLPQATRPLAMNDHPTAAVSARVRAFSRGVVARRGERQSDPADDERGRPEREPEPLGAGHRSRAAMRATESSAFGTKPRAPLSATSVPKSQRSRLDVSTTAGPLPFRAESRAATSNPSISGS